MKCFVSFVCFLSVLVFVSSAPVFPVGNSFSASTSLQLGGSSGSSSSGGGANGLTNILSNIDLPGLLRGVNSFVKLVGVFCPPLSQVLDNVIQNVTSTAFRVFGSAILRSGGLGGGSSGGGQKVSVVLPTYPPDDEDDEDEDDDNSDSDSNSESNDSGSSTFNAELLSRISTGGGSTANATSKTAQPLILGSAQVNIGASISDSEATTTPNVDAETTVPISVSEIRVPSKVAIEISSSETTPKSEDNDEAVHPTTLYTSPANEDSNLISKRHIRVPREAEDDQDGAESAPEPADDLSNVSADDQDRNKRYLPFGGTVEGHASGGGSGNFLFDIIRNTADRAARTVGTVYRMVAGTENLGWGLAVTSESSLAVAAGAPTSPAAPSAPSALFGKLVAGSGATEESDEKANAPGGVAEVDIQKSHEGYAEPIPGPITRLFVIANRGLANLVQDLILRLAATSEKIVNFKARLITSLI